MLIELRIVKMLPGGLEPVFRNNKVERGITSINIINASKIFEMKRRCQGTGLVVALCGLPVFKSYDIFEGFYTRLAPIRSKDFKIST